MSATRNERTLDTLHARWRWGRAYLAGIALFGLALLLRLALLPEESGLPFLTFYPTAIIAFYFLGSAPGWLHVALSATCAFYFFTPPFHSLAPSHDSVVATATFVFGCWLIHLLVAGFHRAAAKLSTALARLEINEQRLRAILADQTELICRFRLEGTIVYVNEAYCRFFGITSTRAIGMRWQPLVLAEDLPDIERKLRSLTTASPIVTIENRVRVPDGRVLWCEFVNRGIFDAQGGLLEVQVVGRCIQERKVLEQQLAQKSAEIADLFEHAPCGFHALSADGVVQQINSTELEWLGMRRDEVVGKLHITEMLTDEGRELFRRNFPGLQASGRVRDVEVDLLGRGIAPRRVSISATAIFDAAGNFKQSRSVLYDITQMARLRDRLHELSVEQAAMLDNELVGILRIRQNTITWASRAIHSMLGYDAGALVGAPLRCLFPDDESFRVAEHDAGECLAANRVFRTQTVLVRHDGTQRWIDLSAAWLAGKSDESIAMLVDITAIKERHDRIEFLAFHDPLTGLHNRQVLNERLAQAIALAERSKKIVATCFVDLDGFKPVNDRHGHAMGDKILKEIAVRLQANVRSYDTLCRVGGDEFVLLLTNLIDEQECEIALTRILDEIAKPIRINGDARVTVSASIGVALYPADTTEAAGLLRMADDAMYQAKAAGRNRFLRYRQRQRTASGA